MAKNIEERYKHRMGEKKITLLMADGSPLANAEVTIRQVKHQFLFGCGAVDSIPLANDELDGRQKELTEQIFEKFFELFNYVTLPFYWARFEPVRGKPDTQRVKKA